MNESGESKISTTKFVVNEKIESSLPETIILNDKILSEEALEKVKKQWELYLSLSKVVMPNEIKERQKNGLPELAEGTLVHGTRFDIGTLKSIKAKGVISGELIGIPEDGETHYCADFFRLPEDMNVGDYMKWIRERIYVGNVKMQKHENYMGKNNSVIVIFNTKNEEMEKLLKMDAYSTGYENMKDIISYLPVDRNGPDAKRTAAILCGVPSNFISGIILPNTVEKDERSIEDVKNIFGDNVSYFNIEGNEV